MHEEIKRGLSEVFLLEKSHIKIACQILAEAFNSNQFIMKIIPNEKKRIQKMAAFFIPVIRYALKYGIVYSTSDNLEGIIIWLPSEKSQMNFIENIRCGGVGANLKLSIRELFTLAKVNSEVAKFHKKSFNEPHWFLATIGVDPKKQGMGFCRKLVQPMLNYLKQTKIPAYLETNSEKNVAIYQKFGFSIKQKNRLQSISLNQWIMCTNPK